VRDPLRLLGQALSMAGHKHTNEIWGRRRHVEQVDSAAIKWTKAHSFPAAERWVARLLRLCTTTLK
jgi:hypothetical protein